MRWAKVHIPYAVYHNPILIWNCGLCDSEKFLVVQTTLQYKPLYNISRSEKWGKKYKLRVIMACVRYIGETRASSNSSKNHTFLISRIWKMGRNLFSSLAIKDNLKVAYLEKNSNNPKKCLVTGSAFFDLSILCNCTTVLGTGCVRNLSWDLWDSLSVNLALANCVELRCACEIFVALSWWT